jgi:YgiT-type zinc finger domain-containing protein
MAAQEISPMTEPQGWGEGKQGKGRQPETDEQRKARLMAAAEAAIDRLLAWEKRVDKPTLTAIEDEVLAIRHELGLAMAQTVLDEQAERSGIERAGEPEQCPECGGLLVNKGRRKRKAATRLGEVETDRPYAYCPQCGRGLFPPGPAA